MALMTCPECEGKVSSKAIICPHCGYPMQDKPIPTKPTKKGKKRRPNGSGTVVEMSGNRSNPYQVRANTHLDDRGYPIYDVLGNYPDRVQAEIVLAKYNENPYNVDLRSLTFTEVYERWYYRKFERSPNVTRVKRSSLENAVRAAYKKCIPLHEKTYSNLRTQDMQDILDDSEISHATTEHIQFLLKNMGKYAFEFDISIKDYASLIKINKEDDDEHGVPFTDDELEILWSNKDNEIVEMILIMCYSGFRISAYTKLEINLNNLYFKGGVKNKYSKERIVPIHSGIVGLVKRRLARDGILLKNTYDFREDMYMTLEKIGIEKHTPHDCRHTFNVLLDDAGASRTCRLKLMGHAGKNVNEKVYAHKSIDELREAVEMIEISCH